MDATALPKKTPWMFSSPMTIFLCVAAEQWHESIGAPNGMPALLAYLANYLALSALATWVLTDAQRMRRTLPYDFGAWVFIALPCVGIYYVFSTRRLRAFILLGKFLLLNVAATLVGMIPLLFSPC